MEQKKNLTFGFTCSAFDLCHAGHMLLFKEAKDNCDYLIVGLQEDQSVDNHINMQYRGKLKPKPVMSLRERKIILESIKYIDEIFVYRDEEDLYRNIKKLAAEGRYQKRFIGDDYKGRHYTGDDVPHQIFYISRDHGYSTSELRERVYTAELERIAAERAETQSRQPQTEGSQSRFKKIADSVERYFGSEKQQAA